MSFKRAYGYLRNYRNVRRNALNNSSANRMHWFSDDVTNWGSLITDYFGAADENKTWVGLYTKHGDKAKLQAEELKIGFLCGGARDIATRFACDGLRTKTPIDADRFEYMRLGFHNLKTEMLKQHVESKEQGIK